MVASHSGAVVGQAIADHPMVRKLGFTGSTPIGKTIMERSVFYSRKKNVEVSVKIN